MIGGFEVESFYGRWVVDFEKILDFKFSFICMAFDWSLLVEF